MDNHVKLPATPAAAEQARAAVRTQLTRWDMPACVDDCLLVASELVTNAVIHGAAPIRMHLQRRNDVVRISVEDGQVTDSPDPRDAEQHDPHGRGLFLVEALCQQWGWSRSEKSKTVWADVGCGTKNLTGG